MIFHPVLLQAPKSHFFTKNHVKEFLEYFLDLVNSYKNYLKDGRVEIDNNLVENAIRPFALGRKNWIFSGSPEGANAGAIFYSLIETCKANNIDPFKYFCEMFKHIRECKNDADYGIILPQNIQFNDSKAV